jgi:hypothetical protein
MPQANGSAELLNNIRMSLLFDANFDKEMKRKNGLLSFHNFSETCNCKRRRQRTFYAYFFGLLLFRWMFNTHVYVNRLVVGALMEKTELQPGLFLCLENFLFWGQIRKWYTTRGPTDAVDMHSTRQEKSHYWIQRFNVFATVMRTELRVFSSVHNLSLFAHCLSFCFSMF